jgi:hypothetical protein
LKLLFAAIALACVAARSEFDFANTAADKVEMDLNKVPVLGSRFVSTLQLLAFCREVLIKFQHVDTRQHEGNVGTGGGQL